MARAPKLKSGKKVLSRDAAKVAGSLRYFTGIPCHRGHISERLVSNCCCVECKADNEAAWREKNTEHVRAKGREYDNKPSRKHRNKYDPAYQADWYEKNKEKQLRKSRERHAANPEKHRLKNRLRYRAYPEASREKARNDYARRKKAKGRHTKEEVAELFIRQDGRCANELCSACIKEKYHEDHIVALSLGGSNYIQNIQLLCPPCNLSKGAKPLDVWLDGIRQSQ